jgi:hypothetical protein
MRYLFFFLFLSFSITSTACSIFTAEKGDQILVGTNEDGDDPFGKMWLMPAREGRFGGIYFGLSFLDKQAGMNEHGLFFDYAALNPVIQDFNEQSVFIYIEEIMETCKTVEEAVSFLTEHGYSFNRAQLLLADARGNSVIVTPDRIIRREENYQIATNFNACSPAEKAGCLRYQYIEQELKTAQSISANQFRDLLQQVHVEGENTTLYSKVFDLKARTVTVYNFHDFGRPVEINLNKMLQKGFQMQEIHSMFNKHSFAEKLYRSRHSEVLANTLFGLIRNTKEERIEEVVSALRTKSDVDQKSFEQQLTKAIIEAIIVERLAVDNYSIVHQFLPYPHAFYEQGWQVQSGVLERCQKLLTYMEQSELGFYYLAAGIPPEANMLPQIQGYLQMVTR